PVPVRFAALVGLLVAPLLRPERRRHELFRAAGTEPDVLRCGCARRHPVEGGGAAVRPWAASGDLVDLCRIEPFLGPAHPLFCGCGRPDHGAKLSGFRPRETWYPSAARGGMA